MFIFLCVQGFKKSYHKDESGETSKYYDVGKKHKNFKKGGSGYKYGSGKKGQSEYNNGFKVSTLS
jgi:hypothetical protein